MKLPCLVILIALVSMIGGCATGHHPEYVKYRGNQAWPISRDAVAESRDDVPVYHGWPARPYVVTGVYQLPDARSIWNERDTQESAHTAKLEKGDALVILAVGDFSLPDSIDKASALVIRWKSNSEIAEESHLLDGLRAYIRRSYPLLDLGSKNDLWEMAVEYVTSMGLDVNEAQGSAKLEDIISTMVLDGNSPGTSGWVFKWTSHTGGRKRGEFYIYGTAKLTRTRDEIVILFQNNRLKMAFNGKLKDGELSGKLTLPSGAGKPDEIATGLLLERKIHLNLGNKMADGSSGDSILLLR